jgi:hypothetical protein
MNHLKILILLICIVPGLSSVAQRELHQFQFEYRGLASTGNFAPFWLQSQQYGKVSHQPLSTSMQFDFFKPFNNLQINNSLDYSYRASLLALASGNTGNEIFSPELYLHVRWLIFDLMAGIKEEKSGFIESDLSVGGFLNSANARPFPKITAGIERFTAFPLTGKMLEFKGAISHGWFNDNIFAPGIMMHHKYLHLRLGGGLPVGIYAGLDHVAQWGGNLPNGTSQQFSIRNFSNIFLGRSGVDGSHNLEQANVEGNHIISQHLKIETRLEKLNIQVYWEVVTEDNPIKLLQWNTRNRRDGLWGVTIKNDYFPWLNNVSYEYFNTLDQGGIWHDKDGIVYGGIDKYLYNYLYKNGWSHFRRTVGSPLILSPVYNKNQQIEIFYNDVRSHHLGISGKAGDWSYKALGTYSRYYPDNRTPYQPHFFWMLEVNHPFPRIRNGSMSIALGGDTGSLTGNNNGVMLTFRKSGFLFQP